jgi:hypothetical protein
MKRLLSGMVLYFIWTGWAAAQQPTTLNQVYTPNGNANGGISSIIAFDADSAYFLGGVIDFPTTTLQELTFSKFEYENGITRYFKISYPGRIFYTVNNAFVYQDGFVYIGAVSEDSAGISRTHLLKLHPMGELVWSREYEHLNEMCVQNLLAHPGGGFLLTGWQDNGFMSDNTVWNQAEMFLMRVDSAGNFLWKKSAGIADGLINALGYCIYITSTGEYIVSGAEIKQAVNTSQIYSNGFFVKFNENGTKTVKKKGRYGQDEWVVGSLVSLDNNLILAPSNYGHAINFSAFSVPAVMVMDENLNEISSKVLDSIPRAGSYGLGYCKYAPDGNLVCQGYYDKPMDEYQWNFSVAMAHKITPQGDVIWKREYVYNELHSRNFLYDIEPLPDGGLLLAGQTMDELNLTGNQQQRMWVVRTDEWGCVVPGCQYLDTKEPIPGVISVGIFPNPVTDRLNVYNPVHGSELNGFMTDIHGKRVVQGIHIPPSGTAIIPMEHLPSGVYVLNLTDSKGNNHSEKIIKN